MALGLHAEPPTITKKMNHHMMWNRIRLILREPILEFFGTFIYVLFGDSVIAQWKLSKGEYGSWVNVCFGYVICFCCSDERLSISLLTCHPV